ncbi:MAG: 2-C-methyl-D-erythritol 4-phosphate cytidylyltransferase [Actinomycetota bacterium]|nr:2-C-methyl-D-erythritol 4-phosphate cytidylyltransferase [Actinomycetota bacterium]
MRTWAIVVAAGDGARFGGAKQFVTLGGVSVVDRSVGVAREACDGVVVVLPAASAWTAPAGVVVAVGGATRSDSVRAGLAAVPADVEVVIVHDAARPLASRRLFDLVVKAVVDGADGAVPALAVSDTVKRVRDDRVIETVARDGLVVVQTPQAFRAGVLRAAHRVGAVDTDDAALVEADGGTVVVVAGERRNLKLTRAEDLEVAEALLDGART